MRESLNPLNTPKMKYQCTYNYLWKSKTYLLVLNVGFQAYNGVINRIGDNF